MSGDKSKDYTKPDEVTEQEVGKTEVGAVLTDDELTEVSGGINPQPLPPGKKPARNLNA